MPDAQTEILTLLDEIRDLHRKTTATVDTIANQRDSAIDLLASLAEAAQEDTPRIAFTDPEFGAARAGFVNKVREAITFALANGWKPV